MFSDPFKIDIILSLIIIVMLVLMVNNHRKPKASSSDIEGGVDLNKFIEGVEANLREGELRRQKAGLERFFEVKTFDLEVNFVVKSQSSEKGQVSAHDFIVLSAGSEVATEQTQKMTLHMVVSPPKALEKKAGDDDDTTGAVNTSPTPPPKPGPSPSTKPHQ